MKRVILISSKGTRKEIEVPDDVGRVITMQTRSHLPIRFFVLDSMNPEIIYRETNGHIVHQRPDDLF